MKKIYCLAFSILLMATTSLLAQTNVLKPEPFRIVTTWDGNAWSNGEPNAETTAIFASDFISTTDISAYNIKILPNAKVIISDDTILRLSNELELEGTGKLEVASAGQLIQKNLNALLPSIDFVRLTGFILKFDFTYFCSPVAGQIINGITDYGVSPNVNSFYDNSNGPGGTDYAVPLYDKYFTWDQNATPAGTDSAIFSTGAWLNVSETTLMDPGGKGYISRAPNSFPHISPPQKWQVKFSGVPNTGTITPAIAGMASTLHTGSQTAIPSPAAFPYKPCNNGLQIMNFIGNPYPSALDADTFLTNPNNVTALDGAIYMWAHNSGPSATNPGNGTEILNYTINDYVIYNLTGGISTGRVTGDPVYAPNNSNRPIGSIASCQGFFVKGITNGAGVATFNPDMQDSGITANEGQFYRLANAENGFAETAKIPTVTKNRFWLSLEKTATSTTPALYKELLIGYMPSREISAMDNTAAYTIPASTDGYEKTYDTELFNNVYNTQTQLDSRIEFYSMIDVSNPCPRLAIQGRMLNNPFDIEDIIPLGFSCPAGDYTITAELMEGIFPATRKFWLREYNGLGYIFHDITVAPVSFNTTVAIADNIVRFQIVFRLPTIDNVNPAICNTTVAGFSTIFGSTGQASQSNMGYNWLFTNASGTPILSPINTVSSNFSFSNAGIPMGFVDFGTAYYLKVGVWNNSLNAWIYSSDPCMVSTPVRVITVAGAQQCNGTILWTQQVAASQNSPYGYAWQITNVTTSAVVNFTTTSYTFLWRNDSFGPPALATPGFFVVGNTYNIQVAILYQASPQIIGNYSSSCNVTSARIINDELNNDIQSSVFNAYVYPNPFQDSYNIKIDSASKEQVKVEVYDMIGKLIDTQVLNDISIDLQIIGNVYASGLYHVVIRQGDDSRILKIMKK